MKDHRAPPRGIRTFGPILAPGGILTLGPTLAHRTHGVLLDLGQYRGTPVVMARKFAGKLLGLHHNEMAALVNEGAITLSGIRHPQGGEYVLFDPAWTTADVYDAWAAKQPMPTAHAEFGRGDQMRRRLRVLDDHPYPEHFLEGLFQKLVELGNFSKVEASVIMSLNEVRWAGIRQWLVRRLGIFCAARGTSKRITLEMLRASLPPILRSLPRTCFEALTPVMGEKPPQLSNDLADDDWDADDGFDDDHDGSSLTDPINASREAPNGRIRRRLWVLKELYVSAALYALVGAPALRRAAQLEKHVGIIAKVEALMNLHAPGRTWTVEDFTDALHAYSIGKRFFPNDTDHVRYELVRLFRIIIDRLHAYLRQQPRGWAMAVRRLIVPHLTLSHAFRRELKEAYGHLAKAGQEARKAYSHKLMNELDLVTEAARNRRDEMRAMGNAVRAEMDAFEEGERYRDVAVKLPVLDERGGLAGGEQKVRLRVWRCNEALLSLGRKPLADGELRWPDRRRDGAPSVVRPKFIVEHLDTVGCGGAATREPWMFELDRLGVTASFGKASPEMKERRHRAIVERGLPGFRQVAKGTLNFDIWRGHIRRFGLQQSRHFPPIEQAEYGIRLAYHAIDCVSQSYNRAHEVRQQVRGGWTKVDLPKELLLDSKEAWFRQDVLGKVSRWRDLAEVAPVPVAICETSYKEALALTELHKRHANLKVFPHMPPPVDFRWKSGPGQYVFSSFGKTISSMKLNVLIYYLLVGWDEYLLHDFRHAEAEDAAFDGYSAKLIGFLLGQIEIANTLYYSRLDGWAKEIVDAENLRRRQAEQDLRLSRPASAE